MSRYGIRIRPSGKTGPGGWTRGRQFRRDPSRPGQWIYWRDEWPSAAAAKLRLDRYRELGFAGHVFVIDEKPVYPNETHYSPNFTREELNCKGSGVRGDCDCNGRNPSQAIQQELVELCRTGLEPLRKEYGEPLGILSGYRCRQHNEYVGGASRSMHMSGKAADPAVPKGQHAKLDNAIEKVPAFRHGGRGKYANGGRHVDTGPERTW